MKQYEKESLIQIVGEKLLKLTINQLRKINQIIDQFMSNHSFSREKESDIIVNDDVLNAFGDALRSHHSSSAEPFTKDKFEFALVAVLNENDILAKKAKAGNPGHDIEIREQRFSLKTQADKSLKADRIHISKFMELGKGIWTDKEDELIGLRNQFFRHIRGYDRILVLRLLGKPPDYWDYELIEIPKDLLLEAMQGELVMMQNSTQIVKPGYCNVYENGKQQPQDKSSKGGLKFSLYFDGGGERKLQIKDLKKKYCILHAEWKFAPVGNLE
ncbi:MAG: restriction endonuclease [Deltaproteobacteria bacterium]|nr:restriction endonuclease [Candidatus Zymogenaceae bacterium]